MEIKTQQTQNLSDRYYGAYQIGRYKYADCDSTNEEAMLLIQNSTTPIVLSAEYQHKGRGRRSKHWSGDKAQNIYMSIALKQPRWTTHYTDYQLLACLSVYEVLKNYIPSAQLSLKYPNDILVWHEDKRKKICGVLVETEFRAQDMISCVCGIGLNVHQKHFEAELAAHAASLFQITHKKYDLDQLIDEISEMFFRYLDQSADDVFASWVRSLDISGKQIHINESLETVLVCGIERNGSLRIRSSIDGNERIMDQNNSFRLVDHE